MASLRALSSTTTSMLRITLLPRFSLNHTQIRTVLTVTAFEKAMQELHGPAWKGFLTAKQKTFVNYKEIGRQQMTEQMQKDMGDKWEAAAAEESAKNYGSREFQDKVQAIKERLAKNQKQVKA
ncbi:hypothetical protein VM1G_08593 [Cytospora mali]|uniref:Uncharacterized protein n=1 Tax=Cytospora mali TaxID=578113 RepID=A0A194W8R3_CYTMA|nr:hypothetical protein VM1G_08593 [Valsa mali]